MGKTINENETKYSTFYLNSKAETFTHDSDIDNVFESIYSRIITKIQKYQEEGSGWTTVSVIKQTLAFRNRNLKVVAAILNCKKN